MKKIEKWIRKQETHMILLALLTLISLAAVYWLDDNIKLFYTIFAIPIMTFLLKEAYDQALINRGCDMNIQFEQKFDRQKSVWQEANMTQMDKSTYMTIENSGRVDIYEIFLKISKRDGGIYWYKIQEYLLADRSFVLKVPCDYREIREVVISGDVIAGSKTKRFSGSQSGNGEIVTFSKVINCEGEKESITHEHQIGEFVCLERFWE